MILRWSYHNHSFRQLAIFLLLLAVDNFNIYALSNSSDTKSVKYYGAIGDGVQNDTKAFIKATANNSSIYIAEGKYTLDTILVLPSGFSMRGKNKEHTSLFFLGSLSISPMPRKLNDGHLTIKKLTLEYAENPDSYKKVLGFSCLSYSTSDRRGFFLDHQHFNGETIHSLKRNKFLESFLSVLVRRLH